MQRGQTALPTFFYSTTNGLCQPRDDYRAAPLTALDWFSMGATLRSSFPSCDYCGIISPVNSFMLAAMSGPGLRQSQNKVEVVRKKGGNGRSSEEGEALLSLRAAAVPGRQRGRRRRARRDVAAQRLVNQWLKKKNKTPESLGRVRDLFRLQLRLAVNGRITQRILTHSFTQSSDSKTHPILFGEWLT